MIRYVVNTTNDNDTYSFFMPLSCMIWKKIIGYKPIALFVGSEVKWMSTRIGAFIVSESRKFAQVHFISLKNKIQTSTIAQVSRLYAAAIPDLNNEDYIIISDVDTFPINRDWFYSNDLEKDFHVWNRNVFDNQQRFAMCHLGAKVKIWRKIMKINILDLTEVLNLSLEISRDNWRYDETLATEMILQWDGWPQDVQLIGKKWDKPKPAIYRGGLNDKQFPGTVDNYVEAHVWRPGFQSFSWKNNLKLLKCLCFKQDVEYAINYKKQFDILKHENN